MSREDLEFEKLRDQIESKIRQTDRRHGVLDGLLDASVFTKRDLGIKASAEVFQQRDNGIGAWDINKAIGKVAGSVEFQRGRREKEAGILIDRILSKGFLGYLKLRKRLGFPKESFTVHRRYGLYLPQYVSLVNPGGLVFLREGSFPVTIRIAMKNDIDLEATGNATNLFNKQTAGEPTVSHDGSKDETHKSDLTANSTIGEIYIDVVDGSKFSADDLIAIEDDEMMSDAETKFEINIVRTVETNRVHLRYPVEMQFLTAQNAKATVITPIENAKIRNMMFTCETVDAGASAYYAFSRKCELCKTHTESAGHLGVHLTKTLGMELIANTMLNAKNDGFSIRRSRLFNLNDNIIKECGLTGAGGDSIVTSHAFDGSIIGNQIGGNYYGQGIYIYCSSKNMIIDGNMILASGSHNIGIDDYCYYILVVNNMCLKAGINATGDDRIPIREWGNSDVNYIADNFIWWAPSGVVEIKKVGANTRVERNKGFYTDKQMGEVVDIDCASAGWKTAHVTFPVAYPSGLTPYVKFGFKDASGSFAITWWYVDNVTNTGFDWHFETTGNPGAGAVITIVWKANLRTTLDGNF